MSKRYTSNTAQQTFRQFAWNLAGTIASVKTAAKPGAAATAKPGGKR